MSIGSLSAGGEELPPAAEFRYVARVGYCVLLAQEALDLASVGERDGAYAEGRRHRRDESAELGRSHRPQFHLDGGPVGVSGSHEARTANIPARDFVQPVSGRGPGGADQAPAARSQLVV